MITIVNRSLCNLFKKKKISSICLPGPTKPEAALQLYKIPKLAFHNFSNAVIKEASLSSITPFL